MTARDDLIRAEAQDLICRVLGLHPDEVQPAARIREDLGLDPFDLADLLVEMESHFGVQIADHVLEQIATVGDIVGTAHSAVARRRRTRREAEFADHRVVVGP
jgi:acyl carrier protein